MSEDCKANQQGHSARGQFFGVAAGVAQAEQYETFTADLQSASPPLKALANLIAGNTRLVAGAPVACHLRIPSTATAAK